MTDRSNVTPFPPKPEEPEWLIGPFEEYRVVIEGRRIPRLAGFREGEKTFLVVDGRFSVAFPHDIARDAAWLVANALAVGEGYAWLGAEAKERPFAPRCAEITLESE